MSGQVISTRPANGDTDKPGEQYEVVMYTPVNPKP